MGHLPTDPTSGNWVITPDLTVTAIFANISGTKRFQFAWCLDSRELMKTSSECEYFMDFLLRNEESIIQGALRKQWGYKAADVGWKPPISIDIKSQDAIVKQAIQDYLHQFQSGTPSNAQMEAFQRTGLPLTMGPEAGRHNWEFVFYFFPNLFTLVSYEHMFMQEHLTRLWIFAPRDPRLFGTQRFACIWKRTDITDLGKLKIIDSVNGDALRALVRFCHQRRIFVREEARHNEEHPLPAHLWSKEERIALIAMQIRDWLDQNYTLEVIRDMHRLYKALHNFLIQLWDLAREYATEDGKATMIHGLGIHPDPDHIDEEESGLKEEVVAKQAIERLLITLGTPRAKKNTGFAITTFDDFITYYIQSNPENFTYAPSNTFRNFIKRWRSETILRQLVGAGNYTWTNLRDEDFLEGPVRQVYHVHELEEERLKRRAAQPPVKVIKPKLSFIDRVTNMIRGREASEDRDDDEEDDDETPKIIHHITLPKDYDWESRPPIYPTGSPVPESQICLQEFVLSNNRLGEENRGSQYGQGISNRTIKVLKALGEGKIG